MYSMEAAVAKGAARLDEAMPGWQKYISSDDLYMGKCTHCVIGTLREVGLATHEPGLDPFDEDHGFCLPEDEGRFDASRHHRWDDLRDLWLAEVNKRTRSEQAHEQRHHRTNPSRELARR